MNRRSGATTVANRRNTDQAPRTGDPGTYNEFWWERGNLLKHTAIIVDPPDGKVPPLTPEGRRRVSAYADARRGHGPADSWEDRNLHERCILYHGVPPLPTGYNNNYERSSRRRVTWRSATKCSRRCGSSRSTGAGTCLPRFACGWATLADAGRATRSSWSRRTSTTPPAGSTSSAL